MFSWQGQQFQIMATQLVPIIVTICDITESANANQTSSYWTVETHAWIVPNILCCNKIDLSFITKVSVAILLAIGKNFTNRYTKADLMNWID